MDGGVAQKPCCCLPGSAEVLDPHVGHPSGDDPGGELAGRSLGSAWLPTMPIGRPVLGSASSAAVTGASSAVLLSRAAEEDTLLMTLGVLGSESPCTQPLLQSTSYHRNVDMLPRICMNSIIPSFCKPR